MERLHLDRRVLAAAIALVLLLGLLAVWTSDEPPTEIAAAPARAAVRTPAPAPAAVLSVEADEPEPEPDDEPEDPHRTVLAKCRVEPPLPEAAGFLTYGEASAPPAGGQPVEIVDGTFHLPPRGRLGAGVLTIDGYAPVRVLWGGPEQGCAPNPIPLQPGETWITGRVANARGGEVWVEGCGARAEPDEDGAYAMTAMPGRCTIDAFRRDGWLVVGAGAAEIEVVPGDEAIVDFTLPDQTQGGLGMSIRASDDGMHVVGVVPGSAAAELGLARGDLVIEVDGTATAGMDARSFVDLAIGPAGTEVDLVVDREGVRERLTLDRRVLQ